MKVSSRVRKRTGAAENNGLAPPIGRHYGGILGLRSGVGDALAHEAGSGENYRMRLKMTSIVHLVASGNQLPNVDCGTKALSGEEK